MAVGALGRAWKGRDNVPAPAGAPPTVEMRDRARVVSYAPQGRNTLPTRHYYLFMMLPAIVVLACITIYPFFWLIWMSLHDVDVGAAADKWNSFRNWTRLPDDSKFINGWVLLIKYSVVCMLLEMSLGIALAIILNRSRFEKTLITIFLMPMMMAPVVAGLVWYYLYNSTFGWYHWLMQSLGLLGAKSILGDPATAMLGIVIVDVWQWTPLS
jgi:multiple sugar transport system permease protein